MRFLGLRLLSGTLTGDGTQVDAGYPPQFLIRREKFVITIMQKDEGG